MVDKNTYLAVPQQLIQPVLDSFSDGKIQVALDSSEELRKNYPNDPLLLNIIGACFSAKGQDLEAINFYKKSLTADPKYAKAYFNLGGALHKINQFENAVLNYEKSTSIDPLFAEAFNNLGNVFKDMGQIEKALSAYIEASKIKLDFLEPRLSLGILYQDLGEIENAVSSYKEALLIDPNFFEVHNNVGVLYQEIGQIIDAESHFNIALSIHPGFAEANYNLGNVLKDKGLFDDAIDLYEKAIRINPKYEDAYFNLGSILHEIGKLESAIECYRNALAINTDFLEAHLSLGVALHSFGDLEGSIKSYEYAIKINPNDAHIYFNLALVMNALDDFEASIGFYQKALALKPDMAEAHNNIGNIFNEKSNYHEAIKSYENAIIVMPEYAEAHHHLGIVLKEVGEFEKAIESFNHAIAINPKINFIFGELIGVMMNICSWEGVLEGVNRIVSGINNDEAVSSPFQLLSLIDDPMAQRRAAETYSDIKFPRMNDLQTLQRYSKHSKIRIGYFSSDFRDHAVSYLTAELYELHDRKQFEVHAFSIVEDTNDIMNLRIKEGVDYFHNVDLMSSKEIVDYARSLEIDIAIDLNGFTAGARTEIFSMFVAPIQLSYIGYLGTMGSDCYDYLIADKIIIPEESQKFFSEKIVYLPSFQVNDSKDLPPENLLTREDIGLSQDKFVFCCFNNTYKLNPIVLDSWARILEKAPESILIVYASNEPSKINLTKEITNRGVDSSRLIFADNVDRPEYLARFRLVDLFLDTHPYNAGTTASDALKMGLPVLTFTGDSFQARMGASILNAANMPELITSSIEDYEALAIELAQTPKKIRTLKDKLINNLSTAPLYDTKLFAKSIESAYKTMHSRNHKGLMAENIFVS